MGKGICYDFIGVIMEKLINGESYKEDPSHSPKDEDIKEDKYESLYEDEKQETSNQLPQYWTISKDHMLDQILCDMKRGVSIRSHVNNLRKYFDFIYHIQPNSISDALLYEG